MVNGPYNYTGDGNIANWPQVVRRAQKLGAVHVLPAHGTPGGPEILSGQAEFFVELHKAVAAAVKQKKKLADLVTMEGNLPKATTVKLPDSVKNWVGDSLPSQVQGAYREITEKKPIGEILGGK